MSKFGKKFTCWSCAAKFYDLNKPNPKCPKCGASPEDDPKKDAPPAPPANYGDDYADEADEEVQDLLNASAGDNLGIDFLPGAFGWTDEQRSAVPEEAARVLWLDAFCANVDRSWRNPNLLVWHGDLWVIDHGASLYFHHGWPGGSLAKEGAAARFAQQPWDDSDHVLRDGVGGLSAVDSEVRGLLGPEVLTEVLSLVPDAWLEPVPGADSPEELRAAYVAFLTARLASRAWLPGSGTSGGRW